MLKDNNLKIAVQKSGRLTDQTLKLLKQIGLDFELSSSKLFAKCQNMDIELLFVRDDDIPEYVQDGVCELGIVGENILYEKGAKVKSLERLGYGKCNLSIGVPKKSKFKIKELEGQRIATSYPNSLKKFLRKNKINAQVIEINGAVEITPALNIADSICDLVSSGITMRQNGLKIVETIFESQSILVQNKNIESQAKQDLIEKILMRIRGVLKAKKTKYVMLNAPKNALPKIQKIIPGLKSPTVIPLSDPEMIAVHSVVPTEVFWEVIEKLKAVGATGILVSPIEQMFE